MWYIHTTEHSSKIKRNKLLTHGQISKHHVIKRRNIQKTKYHMIPFILNSGKGKTIEAEKRYMVAQGQSLNTKE